VIGIRGKITRNDLLKIAPGGGKGIFLLPDNVPDCYLLPAYKYKTNARGGLSAEARPCLITNDNGSTHLDLRVMGIPTCDIGEIISNENYYWENRPDSSFEDDPHAHIQASFIFLEKEIKPAVFGEDGYRNYDAYLFVPYGGTVKNHDDSLYTKRDTSTTPSFGGAIGARGEKAIQLRCKIDENLLMLQRKYGSDIGKTKSTIDLMPIADVVAKYQNLVKSS